MNNTHDVTIESIQKKTFQQELQIYFHEIKLMEIGIKSRQ